MAFNRLGNLRTLNLLETGTLVTWKAGQIGRSFADRLRGRRALRRQRVRYGAAWLRSNLGGDVSRWLARPAAGRWWFAPHTAEAWAAADCDPQELALAERAIEWRLQLLGSSTRPADPPEWRRDLYSGIEWPLEPASTLRIARGDGSDIRTVWELSRCYHFLALGRAWASTREPRYAAAFQAHVHSFLRQNPPGLGPHWASPMDVAIRAANWCLAVQIFAGAALPAAFWAEVMGDLRFAGWWVERHLEWHPRHRGNHFVANLVGLLYLGTLFRGERWGDRWFRKAVAGLRREIEYQVGADGVAFEGSIGYHRLHTELFGYAGELLRANSAGTNLGSYDTRLERMSAFIAAYLQPDGTAPMIGDADDGRLHAMSATAVREPRRHALGLPTGMLTKGPGDGAFAFAKGGFFVLRHGPDHAVIRCGPVGIKGAGSHDHCDQLGFELVVAGHRLVSDSGTYAYTRDLAARHAFRSTRAHSVIEIGGEEQNPIAADRPWRVVQDRTRARSMTCERMGTDLVFRGEHFGYAHRVSGAVCRRTIRFETASSTWQILDEVSGSGIEHICWRLQLAPATLEFDSGEQSRRVRVELTGGAQFDIRLDYPAGLRCSLSEGIASDRYGATYRRPVLLLEGHTTLPFQVECRIDAAAAGQYGGRSGS